MLEILGITLILVCYVLIPCIPIQDQVYFGYPPYIENILISSIVVFFASLIISYFLLQKNTPLRIPVQKIYFAFISATLVKAILLLNNSPWAVIRNHLFKNTSSFIINLTWHLLLPLSFLIFMLIFKKSVAYFPKLFGAFGFAILLVVTYRFISNIDKTSVPRWENKILSPAPALNSRRVVWVVLDEFDPEIAFSKDQITKLPNFKDLLARAVFFKNNYPPADSTIYSIPSMLMGVGIKDAFTSKTAKLIINTDKQEIKPFEYKNTIFKKLKDIGLQSEILGFYHPYCEIFSEIKCKAYPMYLNMRWYSGLTDIFGHRSMAKVFTSAEDASINYMSYITHSQISLLSETISMSKADFIFIHLNIPHLPSSFADKYLNKKSKSMRDEYSNNLEFSDLLLQDILKYDQHNIGQKSLLLLTSDHWFRLKEDNKSIPHPSLFIAKLSDSQEPLTISSRSSSVNIADLIENFFLKKISTHKELADYYSNKPYYETYIRK